MLPTSRSFERPMPSLTRGHCHFQGSERAVSAHAQGFLVGWEMRLVAGRCLRRIYEGGNIYSVGKPAAALGQ